MGIMGIFLIMGNTGLISSTVGFSNPQFLKGPRLRIPIVILGPVLPRVFFESAKQLSVFLQVAIAKSGGHVFLALDS